MERRGSGLRPSHESPLAGATYDKVSRLDYEKLRRKAIDFALGRKATLKDLNLVRQIWSRKVVPETITQRESFTLGPRQVIIYRDLDQDFPLNNITVLWIDFLRLRPS